MHALIAVLPGDGIGPEVVSQALAVLKAVAVRGGHSFEFVEAPIGGIAIDATGTALPEETLQLCLRADAVLLGAVGGPKWDGAHSKVRPEQGLLAIRKGMGLFANLRPVAPYPSLRRASPLKDDLLVGVDLLVVRELTGGIYFGEKKREGTKATDTCVYTEDEVSRVVRVACRLASKRTGKVTSVDKANVLETSRLWRSVTTELVKREFPHIKLDHLLVDACAMHLIRRPADFDVVVTENMFGDILTDEASMLSGSIGLLPSASLGEGKKGLYEPIHGSAPELTGRGIANPCGTILSVAMLLRHSLDLESEASEIERAVESVINRGILTADLAPRGSTPSTTQQVGNAVIEALKGKRDV